MSENFDAEQWADEVEYTAGPEILFDPLETMDVVKWEGVLPRHLPNLLPWQIRQVARVLEERHFKGFV